MPAPLASLLAPLLALRRTLTDGAPRTSGSPADGFLELFDNLVQRLAGRRGEAGTLTPLPTPAPFGPGLTLPGNDGEPAVVEPGMGTLFAGLAADPMPESVPTPVEPGILPETGTAELPSLEIGAVEVSPPVTDSPGAEIPPGVTQDGTGTSVTGPTAGMDPLPVTPAVPKASTAPVATPVPSTSGPSVPPAGPGGAPPPGTMVAAPTGAPTAQPAAPAPAIVPVADPVAAGAAPGAMPPLPDAPAANPGSITVDPTSIGIGAGEEIGPLPEPSPAPPQPPEPVERPELRFGRRARLRPTRAATLFARALHVLRGQRPAAPLLTEISRGGRGTEPPLDARPMPLPPGRPAPVAPIEAQPGMPGTTPVSAAGIEAPTPSTVAAPAMKAGPTLEAILAAAGPEFAQPSVGGEISKVVEPEVLHRFGMRVARPAEDGATARSGAASERPDRIGNAESRPPMLERLAGVDRPRGRRRQRGAAAIERVREEVVRARSARSEFVAARGVSADSQVARWGREPLSTSGLSQSGTTTQSVESPHASRQHDATSRTDAFDESLQAERESPVADRPVARAAAVDRGNATEPRGPQPGHDAAAGVARTEGAGTTGATAPRVLNPLRHEALAQAILARAKTLPQQGTVEVRFALSPPELGAVRVRLEARGERLRVEIVASTQTAADTLSPGVSRLTGQLNQAGYSQADVTLNTGTPSEANPHGGQSRDRGSEAPAPPHDAPQTETNESSHAQETAPGHLDRIA